MTPRTLLPAGWPKPKGYANGMAASGRLVLTAGVVGWDTEGNFPAGMAAQCAQTFANIVAILGEADAVPANIVRMTWYVTSRADYLAEGKAIGAAYRKAFGAHYPTMAVVEVSSLMEAAALVEIEAMAVVPERGDG